MDLSIIIVSYNTKELLVDCLRSIQKAVQFISAEVFVVDNNSSDGTVSLIKKKFPKIKLKANKHNLGFSKANNLVLTLIRGKYVLILNPDTRLMSDTIIKMIDFMQDNPQVAVSTCKVELPNGQLDRDCRRHFPTPWRAFCHFSGLSKIFACSKIFDQYYYGYLPDDHQHEIDSCAGAFMMIRKSAIAEVGLFDEDFFFYGEDLDWCYRFKKAGFKIVYTPITKIIHYKGVSSGIKNHSKHLSKASKDAIKRALEESTRAMRLFYKKHYMDKYPFFITWLVISTIKIIGQIRILKA